MQSNYIAIRDALQEIQEAYEREITKWYRIRRRAIKRGHAELALQIETEIARARSSVGCLAFQDWDYKYKYLFQTDRPAHHYHPYQPGYYPGCYGDAMDDC